jgi:hypothetical protein
MQNAVLHWAFEVNSAAAAAETWDLTKFQKGLYYSGIKIFNKLPHDIKDLANQITLFQNALKRFLLTNSFYKSEEYFIYQR